MQLGLPNVRAVFVYQGDERALATAVGMSQSGGQFQPPGAATDDDDFVLCAHLLARVFASISVQQLKRRLSSLKKHSTVVVFIHLGGKEKGARMKLRIVEEERVCFAWLVLLH